jgi:uncharacterized lipoprotein YmbA
MPDESVNRTSKRTLYGRQPRLRPLFNKLLPAIVAGAVLAACASTAPDHFYSLAITGANVDASPAAAASAPPSMYVEVGAVIVPPQVSRSQLLVTTPVGDVQLLEQRRWAGPLASEIGQALSLGVTGELGAIDVFRTPHEDQLPLYRISTNVQRFESVLGKYALVDAVWSVRRVPGDTVLTCRSVVTEKADSLGPDKTDANIDALVSAHRRALARVAGQIARTIRGFGASGNQGCQLTA